MKIALFSSWLPEISEQNKKITTGIANYLYEKNITVVAGGCSGIPGLAIETAHALGAETIGYFPVKDHTDYYERQHEQNIHDIQFYSTAHFIAGFTARSLEMIHNIDAAIVLNGRIGTLSEFGIAVEEGLPIAVITGTGGIADQLEHITRIAGKKFSNNEVVFTENYREAIDGLIKRYGVL